MPAMVYPPETTLGEARSRSSDIVGLTTYKFARYFLSDRFVSDVTGCNVNCVVDFMAMIERYILFSKNFKQCCWCNRSR
jgi:hypothetical protein